MRILITNDDGISAPGLRRRRGDRRRARRPRRRGLGRGARLRAVGRRALRLLRPPDAARAARGRAASPSRARPPTACSPALYEILKDAPPDLVISGVNRGHNVAEDTLYSGTVGGAMEAALHGVRAVALSQYYGPASAARRSLRRGARPRRRRCCGGCSTAPPGRARPTRSSTTSTSRRVPAADGPRHRAPPSRATAPPPPSACCRMSRRTAAPSSG